MSLTCALQYSILSELSKYHKTVAHILLDGEILKLTNFEESQSLLLTRLLVFTLFTISWHVTNRIVIFLDKRET